MDAIKTSAQDRLRAFPPPRLEPVVGGASTAKLTALDPVDQLLVAARSAQSATAENLVTGENKAKNENAPVTTPLVLKSPTSALLSPFQSTFVTSSRREENRKPSADPLLDGRDVSDREGTEPADNEEDGKNAAASTHLDGDYRPGTKSKKRHHSRTSAVFSVEDKAKIVEFAKRSDIQWLLRKENRIKTKAFCNESGYDYETVCVWAASNTPKEHRLQPSLLTTAAANGSAGGSGGGGSEENGEGEENASQSANPSQSTSQASSDTGEDREVADESQAPKRPKRVKRSPAHRASELSDSATGMTLSSPPPMVAAPTSKQSRSPTLAPVAVAAAATSAATATVSRSASPIAARSLSPQTTNASAMSKSRSSRSVGSGGSGVGSGGVGSVSRGGGGGGGGSTAAVSTPEATISSKTSLSTSSIQQLILKKEAHLKAREDQLKADEAALELIKAKQDEWKKRAQEIADREAKVLALKASLNDDLLDF